MKMTKDTSEFIELFNDELSEYSDTIIDDIYNSEKNFNNADVTSGQRIYTLQEIKEITSKL